MYPKNQSFLVLGLSRSGIAAAEFLLERGAKTYIFDDVQGGGVERAVKLLTSQGAEAVKESELSAMVDVCDALVLSPGIPIDHKLAVAFKRAKKAVIGETELAARYLKCCVLAVTGTNGKTTTVSMIAQMLGEGGINAKTCGNIGTPMLACNQFTESDVAVAEISSFQLETLSSIKPHIAVVLNISEDHLNRHYNMENYVYLKSRLLKNQGKTEYAVLNYDDPLVRTFAEKTRANVFWFSSRERVNGAYLENGALYYCGEEIVKTSEVPWNEPHNIENALAAIVCAKLMKIGGESVKRALQSFKGAPHRIEKVGEAYGVTYVDDSKGTNTDSTLHAARCMKNQTILLLGGKDKGYDYTPLFSALKSTAVVRCILYGENACKLFACASKAGYKNVTLTEKFDYAVKIARLLAESGQTVLLSPASASFDEFQNYEERGNRFVRFVRAWQEEESAFNAARAERSAVKTNYEDCEIESNDFREEGTGNKSEPKE